MATEFIKLKKINCQNCHKCVRYCPVKAIRYSGGAAHIIQNECILCGHCFVVCPHEAKTLDSELFDIQTYLNGGIRVVASLAPSFVANFNAGIESMKEALLKLGFADVQETAIGATIVKNEYERLLKEEKKDVVITSCCHSINLLIQKHYPNELCYLADVLSPMQAHCQELKKQYPDAKTVFIGPCISKKDEAESYKQYVDNVLTFDELSKWLEDSGIEIKHDKDDLNQSKARLFPTTGGVIKSLNVQEEGYTYLAVDGVENCINVLKDIEKGGIHKCFIEMSACIGSCVGGPIMDKKATNTVRDYKAVVEYAGKEDFDVSQPNASEIRKRFDVIEQEAIYPSEDQIQEILRKMGKYSKEQQLDCGSCGYNTCRDKAIAVFQNKAEISMCLPYLKEKAESLNNNITTNTPNGIVVLNEKFEVQQINPAAKKILNIRRDSDILGEPIIRVMDIEAFARVLETGDAIVNELAYLADYRVYVERTISYDKEARAIVCIMRDVTDEQIEREKRVDVIRQTAEVADQVVEKQMRIVQEIASLLGETAAETKIALSKLKESISNE